MKPELENSPIPSSPGEAPSTLRETSVMCKTNGGMWKPPKTSPAPARPAAAINLESRAAHAGAEEKLSGRPAGADFLPHGYRITVTRRLLAPNVGRWRLRRRLFFPG